MSTEPLNLNTTTLRPGLLVSLKTGIVGNVKYDKTEIDSENIDTNGVLKAKWQTDKTIENAAEYEAASKVRGKARSLIAGVCSVSAFGYLCPETAKENLDRSIIAARKLVEDFNATAEVTRVSGPTNIRPGTLLGHLFSCAGSDRATIFGGLPATVSAMYCFPSIM